MRSVILALSLRSIRESQRQAQVFMLRGGDWFHEYCTLRENEPNRVNKLNQQTIWSNVQLVSNYEYVSSHISISIGLKISEPV